MNHFLSSVFAVGFSLLAAGCFVSAGELEGEDVADAEQAFEFCNGSDPAFFWQASTQSALRALGQTALLDGNGNLVSTSLAATPSGASLLHYIIGCALPAGTTVYSAQAAKSFNGGGALARSWATAPLTDAPSQRWVTACLLQSLNGLNQHVAIRMSGNNPALADAPGADVSSYVVEDATMFGNLFPASGRGAYACTDVGLVDACGLSASTSTLQRICGLSLTCGVKLLGPCSARCFAEGTGNTCLDSVGTIYKEAISTTVQATVAVEIYPLCSF